MSDRVGAADAGGNGEMEWKTGLAYEEGKGVERNDMTAADWFHKAALQGHAGAMGKYAVYCMEGRGGVKRNVQLALTLWRHASEKDGGDALSLRKLAQQYGCGDVLPLNNHMWAKLIQRAASLGDEESILLHYIHEYDHPQFSESERDEKITPLIKELKTADGMYRLGTMYERAFGVGHHPDKALEWFEKAAELGSARSRLALHTMYTKGQGVPKSEEKAMKWLTRAAHAGDPEAQMDLGWYYYCGHFGLKTDPEESLKWVKKAAAQGECRARHCLGRLYAEGEVVPFDPVAAFHFHHLAAQQGRVADLYWLSCMYRDGMGCVQSQSDRIHYLIRAATSGIQAAQIDLCSLHRRRVRGVLQDIKEASDWLSEEDM